MILKPGILVGIILMAIGLALVTGNGWPLIIGGGILFAWEYTL